MSEQKSFADLAYDGKKKVTRRERFLKEMEECVPWSRLERIIERVYPKAGQGRPPLPLGTMLRVYCMQQWFQLSDPAMEDSLYDSFSMRRFARIGLEDGVPDETTILNFRHLLEKHGLAERIFGEVSRYLEERGLLVRRGTIMDATTIEAPASTKNRDQKRDPEMSSTKKGNQWHFGMKAHVGADSQRGLVHTVVCTTASEHDSQRGRELLHGDEKEIYGDKAYADEARRQECRASGVAWRVNIKGRRGQGLSERDRKWNRSRNAVRAKVEHPFGIVKNLWGYTRVRYRGIYKNACQIFSLFALANIYLARRHLLPGSIM